jgi:acyl-coenzyme A thioesterase PaaI-like protein
MPWPEPDWTPLQPFPFASARDAFSGLTNDEGRIDLRYFRRPGKPGLVGIVSFGPRAEGAPGQVHGGCLLSVLDEALGAVAWSDGRPVLTVRLTTEFRKPVPLGARLLVEARLLSERHRVVMLEGELVGADGALYTEAVGHFMRLDDEAQRRVFGRPA